MADLNTATQNGSNGSNGSVASLPLNLKIRSVPLTKPLKKPLKKPLYSVDEFHLRNRLVKKLEEQISPPLVDSGGWKSPQEAGAITPDQLIVCEGGYFDSKKMVHFFLPFNYGISDLDAVQLKELITDQLHDSLNHLMVTTCPDGLNIRIKL